MKKLILFVVAILVFCSCSNQDDASYYPVGDIDVATGTDSLTGNAVLVAESHNIENQVVDTIADYPDDNTVGKLTFKYDIKNILSTVNPTNFFDTGKSSFAMSVAYNSDGFKSQSIAPIFKNSDNSKKYRVKFRLKGDFHLANDAWRIDYIYPILSKSFHPYPVEESKDVFFCKGNAMFMNFYQMDGFNSSRRAGTFDIEYDKWDLSFDELYFNLFVSLTGNKSSEQAYLEIDKDSYFEIYEIQ